MGASDSSKKQHSPHKKKSQKKSPESRPTSTKLLQFSVPQTVTSYAEDYGPKPPAKTEISDFSTKNMRNNPHPKEAFLSWRLPSRFPPLIEGCPLSHSLSTAELEDCLRQRKLQPISTYQDDYAKDSQNTDELPPLSAATNTAVTATTSTAAGTITHPLSSGRGLHSEMHEAYQTPQSTRHLKGNTSRYGCSSNYVKSACGVVPTLHPIVNAPNYQTWYANEFGVGVGNSCGLGGHRRPPTPIYPLRLPPILKDRTQLMGKSARHRPDKHRSNAKASDDKRTVSSAVKTEAHLCSRGGGGLSWLSEWAGPM